jgi:hypothetical protein
MGRAGEKQARWPSPVVKVSVINRLVRSGRKVALQRVEYEGAVVIREGQEKTQVTFHDSDKSEARGR